MLNKIQIHKIVKYKYAFQSQALITLELQIHTQLKICVPNQP